MTNKRQVPNAIRNKTKNQTYLHFKLSRASKLDHVLAAKARNGAARHGKKINAIQIESRVIF